MNRRFAFFALLLACTSAACGSSTAATAATRASGQATTPFNDTLPQPDVLESASNAPGVVEVSVTSGVNTISLAPDRPAAKGICASSRIARSSLVTG